MEIPSAKVSGTGNIEAYNLILQGNYFFDKLDKENVAKAVDFYNQALAIDSTDARHGENWRMLFQDKHGKIILIELQVVKKQE